ncbi:MAG: hypothetical protein HRT95_11755 [Moritella sp.]|nr:hypothetical protein [Moritella sp.]
MVAWTGIVAAEQDGVDGVDGLGKGEIAISDSTFSCIRDMTKVRGFYVDNLNGNIDATLAVANSATGGKYPEGSVVQLVPGEVMVKHGRGFSPATMDWEFFELDVSDTGSEIRKRGFVDVINRFGNNCFGCHIQAKPEWDLICETGHGCETIPITAEVIELIQITDPRCDDNEDLSTGEYFELLKLKIKVSIGTSIGTVKGWL